MKFLSIAVLATFLPLCAQAEPSVPDTLFEPVKEEHFSRDAPADWARFGANCLARVWQKKDDGSYGDLLLYQHGRDVSAVKIGGIISKFIAFTEPRSEQKGTRSDYLTSLSIDRGEGQRFLIHANKNGKCKNDKVSGCVRAEGFITNTYLPASDALMLPSPVPVIIEDSCARDRNGRFIDDLPFYKKVMLPVH